MFQHVFLGTLWYTVIPLQKAGNLFHRIAPGVKIVKVNSDKIQDLSGSSTCLNCGSFLPHNSSRKSLGRSSKGRFSPLAIFGILEGFFNLGQYPEIKGKYGKFKRLTPDSRAPAAGGLCWPYVRLSWTYLGPMLAYVSRMWPQVGPMLALC